MKWEKNTLGELVKSYGGKIQTGPFGSQLHQHDYKPEGIPVIMPKDIINDRIETGSIARINDDDADRLGKHKLNIGDLVIPRRGDINKRAICKPQNEGWLCGTGCLKIRLNDAIIDPSYLYYYFTLSAVVESILNKAVGSTMLNLSGGILSTTEIVYPPLPTQRKIASILSGYDDLIENNLKRIKLLEEAININYKNLISTEDKNFTKEKLNSFVDIISGFPFKSNYYNENGKYKIVTIKNVQDGFFVPVVTDRIDDIPDNMNKALFLSTGDVIMSLTGNVGRVCLVYGDDYVLNQRVIKLSAKELIDQSFIYALVRDKQMLTILENLSNGTAQQNLSPIKMGELPIRYPSSNLREDFDKKVSPMIELICKLNLQNTKLREARDILLPRLMNGEIEV